jgi:hypothetical protein
MRLRLASVRRLVAAALSIMTPSSVARAEPNDQDKALASSLFDEAKALLVEGKVSAACRKLEESRRLDPLPGTILNLGVCHEREGLMASAFAELREARALADRDHRDDRVALADEHMKAIGPKISSIVVVVDPAADSPGLTLTRDGSPIGRAAWGTRIPVDPGDHLLEASAPNKAPWKTMLTVRGDGDVQTVTLTALEDLPPVSTTPAPSLLGEVSRLSPTAEPQSLPRQSLSPRQIGGIATGATGVVAIGVGTYFGIKAVSDHDAPGALCMSHPCSTQSLSLNDSAKVAADASTVTLILGLSALGTGTVLWFWKRRGSAESKATVVGPIVAPGRAGVEVTGCF